MHTLLSETEEELFGTYDTEAVSLRQLSPNIRRILLAQGPDILNVTEMDSQRVVAYINQSPYASPSLEPPEGAQVDWLNQFWAWAQSVSLDQALINPFYLIPTTIRLCRRTEAVFDLQAEPRIAGVLKVLGILVLDPRVEAGVYKALKQVFPGYNVHALLRALPRAINVTFTDEEADQLCAFFLRHLPSSTFKHGHLSKNPTLRSRLRSIPIFPILSSLSPDDKGLRTSIPSFSTLRGVDPAIIPVLPQVPSTVWLDLRAISQDILQYLDPNYSHPLSASAMHELMLKHFQLQSPEVQLAFVRYLDSNYLSVSHGTLNHLATIAFVHARKGNLRAPKDLVDPEAPIAQLFPGASSSLPDTSKPNLQTLTNHLRNLGLFITRLSLDILRDRIQFISGGHAVEPAEQAKILIEFIRNQSFDCRQLYDSSLDFNLKWIPTSEGLESPLTCRDMASHKGHTHLFDEAIPVVELDVGENLRQAFLWDVEVPFALLSQQLAKVLDHLEPPYEKVDAIVKELSHRSITQHELPLLQDLLRGQKWVPTGRGDLVVAQFAVLGGEDLPEVGFHSIVSDSRTLDFLRRMGCVSQYASNSLPTPMI
jgi:sacsin